MCISAHIYVCMCVYSQVRWLKGFKSIYTGSSLRGKEIYCKEKAFLNMIIKLICDNSINLYAHKAKMSV